MILKKLLFATLATSDPLGGSIDSLLGAMASSALDISKGVYINMKSVKMPLVITCFKVLIGVINKKEVIL